MTAISIMQPTALYGLLGSPVGKSLSPAMHNAHFKALGMQALYQPFDVTIATLECVMPALIVLGFRGLNVTMPLKQAVVPWLDELEQAECGVVNTIRLDEHGLTGTNTDGTGFVRALREEGVVLDGMRCALFGAGGAGRGIAFALVQAGVAHVRLLDIAASDQLRVALASDLNAWKPGVCRSHRITKETVKDALAVSLLVVNATCAGMAPHVDVTPFDSCELTSEHIVADIVYIPSATRLLREAQVKGCRVLSGHRMLLWQAAEAFEFWTGLPAKPQIMEGVLRRCLA